MPAFPAWLGRLGYYALALLLVAAAALVRGVTGDTLSPAPFLVFYLAWVGAAAFGGLGPGLLATVVSWVCVDLFFDPTPWDVGFGDPGAVGRFGVLMIGGLLVSVVGEKMRRTRLRERRQAGELAEAARRLEREKEILQAVMDGARNSHLVYLDRDFNFVRVNETYARTCGYTPEEMIGKNHFALYAHADNQAIFARVRDTGVPVAFHDKPFVFPDQPERGITYWDWTLTPLKNSAGVVEGLVFSLFETTERKRVEEALRELNATLESRVAQRTEELEQRAWLLQTLTLELTEAEEHERARIAEILHDDLQQVLAATKFQLGLLSGRVKNDDPDSREVIAQAKDLLTEAISKSRSLSHELNSPALSQSDLGEALEWLAEQMQAKHGFTVRLEIGGQVEVASEPLRILLYKAAQEMLFNAIKHAGVQEATLRLRHRHGCLWLSVCDQGQGFNPGDPGYKLGLGLLSIRERIRLLGGRMTVRSALGKGSAFFVIVPDSVSTKTI